MRLMDSQSLPLRKEVKKINVVTYFLAFLLLQRPRLETKHVCNTLKLSPYRIISRLYLFYFMTKEEWLSELRKKRLPLTSWKTFKGGDSYLSENIDEILYS